MSDVPENATAPAENYWHGALGVCGGVSLFGMMDALVKFISGTYPVHQIVFLRCIAAAPLLFAFAYFQGGWGVFKIRRWGWTLIRSVVLFAAHVSGLLAVATISLADSQAMHFTTPLFVAGLAGPVLGEKVPLYRWVAIVVAFGGVLVVLRPSRGVFEPGALLAFLSAMLYGLGQMLARKLRQESSAAVAFYWNLGTLTGSGLMALVFASGAFAGAHSKSLEFIVRPWATPTLRDMAIMLTFPVISVLGLPLYTHGYKSAPANFVGMFEYSGMLVAVILGWLLFRDLPGLSTIVGASLVIGAGIGMVWWGRRAESTS